MTTAPYALFAASRRTARARHGTVMRAGMLAMRPAAAPWVRTRSGHAGKCMAFHAAGVAGRAPWRIVAAPAA